MRRSDVGMLVSRSLAVWVFCVVVNHASRLPNSYLAYLQFQRMRPGEESRPYVIVPVLEDLMLVAGLIFIGAMLWTKPTLLFPSDDEPLSKTTTLNILSIRSVVMSALGVFIFVEGFSSLLSVMVVKHTVSQVFKNMVSAEGQQVIGPLAKIVIGAAIIAWFNYGKPARRLLGVSGGDDSDHNGESIQ